MKNLLTAILLLSSVSAYGQGTTYLNCAHTPDSGGYPRRPGRILILDNTQWDQIFLIWEEDLETTLSDAYFLEQNDRTRYKIDRLTGELSEYDRRYDLHIRGHCLPVTRSEVQAILQNEIDRRDAIIAANEEKRLF